MNGWVREKKIKLIEVTNPQWKDLAAHFLDDIMGKPDTNQSTIGANK